MKSPELQAQFDSAFVRYLDMSNVLREDISMMMDLDDDSLAWKRNFVRAAFSLIEGFCHCYREMCLVALRCDAPRITNKERKAIEDERAYTLAERYKYTLRAAYKLFEVAPLPDFASDWWLKAQLAMDRRDRLVHPKTVEDLVMSDDQWIDIYEGLRRSFSELFKFPEHVLRKHGRYRS